MSQSYHSLNLTSAHNLYSTVWCPGRNKSLHSSNCLKAQHRFYHLLCFQECPRVPMIHQLGKLPPSSPLPCVPATARPIKSIIKVKTDFFQSLQGDFFLLLIISDEKFKLSDSSKHFGWYTRMGEENTVWDILIKANKFVKSVTLNKLVNCNLTSAVQCDWQGTSVTAGVQKVHLRGIFPNTDI